MLCQPSTGHHSTASALNSVSTTCSVRVLHGAAMAAGPCCAAGAAPGRLRGGGAAPSASRSGRARGGAAPKEPPLPPAGLAALAGFPSPVRAPTPCVLAEGRGCGSSVPR